jgi:hypothetical protein
VYHYDRLSLSDDFAIDFKISYSAAQILPPEIRVRRDQGLAA